MKTAQGTVWLAGAGPGDAGLLTVKTRELMDRADVIVYDALISDEILCLIPPDKEMIYVGKRSGHHTLPQERINQILLEEAKKGKNVLRLKGGDPFLFGRGGEELDLLARSGIPFEIIPGVTSAIAVPTYAGIPVTHRDCSSSLHIITGHARKDGKSQIDFPALVQAGGTLVFLMGVSSLEAICTGLIRAGMSADMPAAILERGTTSRQRQAISDIGHLPEAAARTDIQSPAIIVVGMVCRLAGIFHWAQDRLLGGRQFLVTRPEQNASSLTGTLRMLGAQVLAFPAIRTKTITHDPAFRQAIAEFGQKSPEAWLVFTSPIGVRTFWELMREQKTDLRTLFTRRANVKIAAIGSGTAGALEQSCLWADCVPDVYDAAHLGKRLADIAAPGSEILILRTAAGSAELIPPLVRAGLPVRDIPLYETEYEMHGPIREQIARSLDAGEIDAVIFTSASTVRGFVKAMDRKDYTRVCAVCIGSQTAAEAKRYGMQTMTAREASIESLLGLICETFASSRS